MDNSFTVTADDTGTRLDAFVASRIDGWSRSRLRRLIDDGDVLVNGSKSKASYKLREGDEIEIELTELPAAVFEPEDIPLDIVYEDAYLAVINKPAGMVVHPGAGVTTGTLANAIAWHFEFERNVDNDSSEKRSPPYEGGVAAASADGVVLTSAAHDPYRIGIVHRLDKDTSGLIVVAKDEQTAEELSRQFHDREVEKSYVALVHGYVEDDSGTIDRPIARHKHHRTMMTVASHGRPALSLWRVKDRSEKFTLLNVDIKTGRTHQIRVHLASINHPVVGDETYNSGRDKTVADLKVRKAIADLGRFFLHAEKLAFTHPKTGERMKFKQPLPGELENFLEVL
ncbi:MAG: RluA family pseudouridine synthase [Acidobacteria bacterium]|nr:RluA family pseudouridine synthase [Acidobacteriota bacterium]